MSRESANAAAVRRFLDRARHDPDAVWDIFYEWDYEVEQLIDRSDRVAVRIHQWGRGKGSGIPVDAHFWQVWEMRDGKAIRVMHLDELGSDWD